MDSENDPLDSHDDLFELKDRGRNVLENFLRPGLAGMLSTGHSPYWPRGLEPSHKLLRVLNLAENSHQPQLTQPGMNSDAGPLEGLSNFERWASTIFYCQSVIRKQIEHEGNKKPTIRIKALDEGLERIEKSSQPFRVPALGDTVRPSIAYRFEDLSTEDWNDIFHASKSAQKELAIRAAYNISHGYPMPKGLAKVISWHLAHPKPAEKSAEDRKRTGDRDNLIAWLVIKISNATGLGKSVNKLSLGDTPPTLSGVTAVAASFSGLNERKLSGPLTAHNCDAILGRKRKYGEEMHKNGVPITHDLSAMNHGTETVKEDWAVRMEDLKNGLRAAGVFAESP